MSEVHSFHGIEAMFHTMQEIGEKHPRLIYASPTAYAAIRFFVEYAPRVRAYRWLSRSTDPVAARVGARRLGELRASRLAL